MNLSIVIPLLNEEESLAELYEWIVETLGSFSYEIIFIDDGSTDDSWKIIQELSQHDSNVKGIRFKQNYGKSQALHAGFKIAQGEVVVTMDADLQDDPEEIPELYHLINSENYDLVSGWKKKRYDSILTKNLPSKLFNAAARRTSGLKLHDFNCGLKAFKRDVVKDIYVYGEMHRYIPVLVKNAGYSKIREKVVKHQARKYGKTKFGTDRFIKGFLDLITLWFLSRFAKRPMHLFGAWGVFMFMLGFGLTIWIGASKLYKLWNHIPDILITQNPWFYIALTTMVIGTQFFMAGFIGELILRRKDKERYQIKETIY
ncbi:MAG TPA: glycosyltransferase family 2 protein [Flavobacteriaceae bacterium]|nr:glycosyltransferase family 2 protein [Flavobacteriaceae bacterium]